MELSGLIAGARQTMYFSNIGRITMPKALAPYVCQFDFFIGCAGRQICMCSYEDSYDGNMRRKFKSKGHGACILSQIGRV